MNNAWDVKEEHFKTKKSMEDKLKFFLEYAILAPSGYNNQPWKFRIKSNQIEIWTDLSKNRKVIDPKNRESYISAGTAITNLVLTARNFGYDSRIKIHKKIGKNKDLDLSAVITLFETKNKINKNDRQLFESITKRQTNRRDYDPKISIDQKKINLIENWCPEKGIGLKLFNQANVKKKLGAVVADAGLFWYKREDFRRELLPWLTDSKSENGDAVWQKFFGGNQSQVMSLVEEKAIRDEMLVNRASAILIIGSESDNKTDWIYTGIELEKILLRLTNLNIQNSYFNTIVQSERHRNKLKSELGNMFVPQLFLRLGCAKKVKKSPRRSLSGFILAIG